MENVDRIMQQGVRDGIFPGGVLCVWAHDKVVFHRAYGVADIRSNSPVTTGTVFDLASLTKPLATAPAVLKLVDMGRLSATSLLCDVLPAFRETEKSDIAISMLLCHTSGLPAHREYFRQLSAVPEGQRNSALLCMLKDEPLVYRPGSRVVYSDLGYMLLRFVVEQTAGMRFDRFVYDTLYKPLGLDTLFFVPLAGGEPSGTDRRCFAATEDCPRRGKVLAGLVHDDNAYEIGGVDGHAGLFGNTSCVLGFLVELLSIYKGERDGGVLSRISVRQMMEKQCGTDRTFGFDTPAMSGSSAGKMFSKRSVGHLGFTGTSCWIDIDRDIIVLLFTNRVHPDRGNEAIKRFRPMIHDAVMSEILAA